MFSSMEALMDTTMGGSGECIWANSSRFSCADSRLCPARAPCTCCGFSASLLPSFFAILSRSVDDPFRALLISALPLAPAGFPPLYTAAMICWAMRMCAEAVDGGPAGDGAGLVPDPSSTDLKYRNELCPSADAFRYSNRY